MKIKNTSELRQFRDLIGKKNFAEAMSLVRDGGTLWIFTRKEFEETDKSNISPNVISFLRERFDEGKEWAGLAKNPPRDWDQDGCVHLPNFRDYIFDRKAIMLIRFL